MFFMFYVMFFALLYYMFLYFNFGHKLIEKQTFSKRQNIKFLTHFHVMTEKPMPLAQKVLVHFIRLTEKPMLLAQKIMVHFIRMTENAVSPEIHGATKCVVYTKKSMSDPC